MTPERENELLEFVRRYARIRGWSPVRMPAIDNPPDLGLPLCKRISVRYQSDAPLSSLDAAWAESEACLRDVAGECAVRGALSHFHGALDLRDRGLLYYAHVWEFIGEPVEFRKLGKGEDESESVAMLKAFVAAYEK